MTTMEEVRGQLAQLRDLKLEITQKEDELKLLKGNALQMERELLVDTFHELGITNLAISAEGNLPAMKATLKPYYKANIEAGWDRDKRRLAFAYLVGKNAGDLIKTVFTISLPRDTEKVASKVRSALTRLGVAYGEEQSVSWNTLTAWLKESVESGDVPDLDKIGGQVGHVVTLKENNDG